MSSALDEADKDYDECRKTLADKDAEIERLKEVERQYLKAEAHLPEGFRYGLVSATFDMHQAILVARREMDDARLKAEQAKTAATAATKAMSQAHEREDESKARVGELEAERGQTEGCLRELLGATEHALPCGLPAFDCASDQEDRPEGYEKCKGCEQTEGCETWREAKQYLYELQQARMYTKEAAPTSEPLFYLLSLKHTNKHDSALTWWRPNSSGYTYYLVAAGKYTQAEIDDPKNHYNDGVDILAVPCAVVDEHMRQNPVVEHTTTNINAFREAAKPATSGGKS